jgi:ADP-heptose:LPS heptosyltransferase
MSARTWSPAGFRATVQRLVACGFDVVVTGSNDERDLTAFVASADPRVADFGGATSFAEFCALVSNAAAVVCGNTATAHVAAATGTPVVHIFPATIPFARFAPWMVPFVAFGDDRVPCAGCRARVCPVPGQPCLRDVTPERIADAVATLVPQRIVA